MHFSLLCSWLAVTPPKGFDLAPLDRLELEDLAMRVSPGECGRVLNLFRDAVDARNPEVRADYRSGFTGSGRGGGLRVSRYMTLRGSIFGA